MILEDTRQQAGKHNNVERYLTHAGIPWERQALYVGDYIQAHDGRRAVDTKQGVMELIHDICSGDHERFARECERAQAAGIRLLILTEEELPSGGLAAWQAPKAKNGRPLTAARPETLRRAMITMTAKYGVQFRFCDARSTGRLVVEYLTLGTVEGVSV
jgi:ERCC4-type nuclease